MQFLRAPLRAFFEEGCPNQNQPTTIATPEILSIATRHLTNLLFFN
jgi:hypothetical protein